MNLNFSEGKNVGKGGCKICGVQLIYFINN